MYDFAHPIEDAIEGITHSICTLEFEDHRPLYDWVVRELEYPHPPKQIEFAKLYLTNVVTGKRYNKKLVEDGIVDGWDDPRLVSIAALRSPSFILFLQCSNFQFSFYNKIERTLGTTIARTSITAITAVIIFLFFGSNIPIFVLTSPIFKNASAFLLLATCRGGSHLTSDIINFFHSAIYN